MPLDRQCSGANQISQLKQFYCTVLMVVHRNGKHIHQYASQSQNATFFIFMRHLWAFRKHLFDFPMFHNCVTLYLYHCTSKMLNTDVDVFVCLFFFYWQFLRLFRQSTPSIVSYCFSFAPVVFVLYFGCHDINNCWDWWWDVVSFPGSSESFN